MGKPVRIEKDFLRSKAFRELTAVQKDICFEFLFKRQMVQPRRNKPGKHDEWIISNNGNIVFPYNTVNQLVGCSEQTFRTAIVRLVEVGIIDIADPGNGLVKGATTKYSISERWRNYGTNQFVKVAPPPKDSRFCNYFIKMHREKGHRVKKYNTGKRFRIRLVENYN